MSEAYIVVCRDDRTDRGKAGPYLLATRRVFATHAEAERYRRTVNRSRQPLVVGGRWHQLRIEGREAEYGRGGEDRG